VSDSTEGWCAAGNLGASRVSIRMDDRTDGQRTDEGTDDGTHGCRGGFISHPDVLYYIGYSIMNLNTIGILALVGKVNNKH
jgi:hypothetical protein